MITAVKRGINNENGFALILAVLMLAVITVIGVAATRTSETESQIASNERQIANQLYSAEGALVQALETATTTWAAPTSSFLTDPETVASYTSSIDFDGDGTNDAAVEIRCIECSGDPCIGTGIAGLSTAANSLPNGLPHRGPPPPGSGYSMKHFEVRRYGVTTGSATGNTQIQAGVYKVFNK